MSKFSFEDEGWLHYIYWQLQDRKTLRRINQLLQSIERDGALKGIGKPERLKHEDGWSRRINDEHRLIYKMKDGNIIAVKSCRGHYEDK